MGAPASESVSTDANLQPQGTGWGQNTSFPSFVNFPPRSFSPSDSSINNASFCIPTPEQAQALAALEIYHKCDIIAWHTLSQSTEPGLKHLDGPGDLSNKEVLAISTLRECSFESLIQWLESTNQNTPSSRGLSASRFATAASSCQTRRPSARPPPTPAHPCPFTSVTANSSRGSNNSCSALTAAQTHPFLSQKIPTSTTYSSPALVKPANPNHTYWCTVCDNRSFQHSDGWKKHEKEHEIKYVCMLKGFLEHTNDGRRCILCGGVNQANSHYLVHNLAPCLEAANRPSFKRRYDMVGHLKDVHEIHVTANSGTIADKWQCKSSKKAWSCGFCIRLFPSLQDRLKHIGTEHFEKGQSIKDWKCSNVIQGLLLQPGVSEAWQHLLESRDPFRFSETKWNKPRSEKLLHKLERGLTGKETPQSLAQAAYDCAELGWIPSDKDVTTSLTTDSTLPDWYASQSLLPHFQDHAVGSREASVECRPWSLPQHQAALIPRSSHEPEAQGAYGTPALSAPPAHLVPALDQSPGLDPMTSDTGDMSSTQPTTPFNDNRFYPADPPTCGFWSGYDITPDPVPSDHEPCHYNSNQNLDWPTYPQSDASVPTIGHTLKRSRDSESLSALMLPCEDPLKHKPSKRAYRKSVEKSGTASQGLGLHYGQQGLETDENTRTVPQADTCVEDGLYNQSLSAIEGDNRKTENKKREF